MITTSEPEELRELTPDEVEDVSGGARMVAEFRYGDFIMAVAASETKHAVCISNDGGKTVTCPVG
jgi:hypothetical protein